MNAMKGVAQEYAQYRLRQQGQKAQYPTSEYSFYKSCKLQFYVNFYPHEHIHVTKHLKNAMLYK